MTTNSTTENKINRQQMHTPPAGWFKAALGGRDAQAMYEYLVEDNARREARGLPTYEPSYELALAAIRA